MGLPILLASGSAIRAELLKRAGVSFEIAKPRVDEDMVREALQAEGESARNIADALAQLKSERVGMKHPEALTIGCDQVLACEGRIYSKPESPDQAMEQIRALSGKRHSLYTAAVVHEGGRPVWRKLSEVKMTMRELSPAYLESYVARNWPDISWSCGAYQVEAEGSRLFSRIEGDYFAILGLPLLELLDYLIVRGALEA